MTKLLKRKIADAVEQIFACLGNEGAERFESLCRDEGLLKVCEKCNANVPIDKDKCDGCGTAVADTENAG